MTSTWQLQAAKQRFSEVVRAAESGSAQFITRHGSPVAVIIDIDDYERTHRPDRSFAEFLLTAPALDDMLELPDRLIEPDRGVALADEWR